ncbi:hypothetical protein ACFOD9_00135 [Novosphingobium bradum]|uniref:Uncharacterized protein n=1 Tax=Novosphingobium bradum TaxID=1737444 RepID=A0ABV7IP94_9SPHN
MKAGTKLKSACCDTEVMVIKAAEGELACGGAPMVAERGDDKPAIDPAFAEGTKTGKRYTDAAGSIELLCTKAGAGSLSLGGVALILKEAKPLPSSD